MELGFCFWKVDKTTEVRNIWIRTTTFQKQALALSSHNLYSPEVLIHISELNACLQCPFRSLTVNISSDNSLI
jgi:hypothetical protein